MSDAPSSSVVDTAAPPRLLDARAVGKKLGREKRVVLLWAEKGCPHSEVRIRGKVQLRFNVDEVKSWLARQGLEQVKAGGTEAAGGGGAGDAGTGEDHGNLWAQVQEWLKAAVDFDQEIARTRLMIQELFSKRPPPSAEAAELQKWTGAFAQASRELRALTLAKVEDLKRRGELLDRSVHTAAVAGLAAQVRTDLAGLAPEVTRALAGELEGKVPADALEAARRVAAATVKTQTDRALERMAKAIEERVSRGGGSPLGGAGLAGKERAA